MDILRAQIAESGLSSAGEPCSWLQAFQSISCSKGTGGFSLKHFASAGKTNQSLAHLVQIWTGGGKPRELSSVPTRTVW